MTDLVVEVSDNGRNGHTTAGNGRGLAGMRERVTLLNGEFHAGPSSEGFNVSARFPLDAPAS
jgi:signal transduction histidine kinase